MSSPLRIELRASRWVPAGLVLLAGGAACALWLSAAPRWALLAVPLLLLAAWPRRPGGMALVLRGDGSAMIEDGAGRERDAEALQLQRRGLLTLLSWRSDAATSPRAMRWPGSRPRASHLFLPDTLTPEQGRQLRLWFDRHRPIVETTGMLPHV